jgi:hypothetical protein
VQFKPLGSFVSDFSTEAKGLATSAPPVPKKLRRSLIRSTFLFYKVVCGNSSSINFYRQPVFELTYFFREVLENPSLLVCTYRGDMTFAWRFRGNTKINGLKEIFNKYQVARIFLSPSSQTNP